VVAARVRCVLDAGATVDELACKVVADGVAPQCAAGCAVRRGDKWLCDRGGALELLFDLASVTKPMTAVAVACAGIALETPLGALLPEARGTPSERIPLELFLAHRAGLEGHRPLYAPLLRDEKLDVAAALHEAAGAKLGDAGSAVPVDGYAPLYSDLGYILAGEALARASGSRDAGEAIGRLVLEPLGVSTQAGTIRELASRGVHGPFATTETVPWRGGRIVGAVHDENAWALTGDGGSGHAGIFGTVDAVLRFGTAVLDQIDDIAAPFGRRIDLDWAVRERPGGTLRAGFDGKDSEGSSAGERMGARAFGHLGFTGTSLWIDPDAKVVITLLTNRVCRGRDHVAIRAARPWAHDWLFDRTMALVSRVRNS
jgi:CubicO group peptidase (beta-lactamase class C family)